MGDMGRIKINNEGKRTMKNRFAGRIAILVGIAFASFVLVTGCGKEKKLSFELDDMPDVTQYSDADIDLDALNDAANSIKDLDLSQDDADDDGDAGEKDRLVARRVASDHPAEKTDRPSAHTFIDNSFHVTV